MNTKNLVAAEMEFPPESTVQHSKGDGTIGTSRVLWTTEDIQKRVSSSKVVIFTKGTLNSPRCGLSHELMNAIEGYGLPYELVDVSKDRSIVPALKAFAGSNNLPLVFINGEMVSCWDTQSTLIGSGELRSQIEKAFVE